MHRDARTARKRPSVSEYAISEDLKSPMRQSLNENSVIGGRRVP